MPACLSKGTYLQLYIQVHNDEEARTRQVCDAQEARLRQQVRERYERDGRCPSESLKIKLGGKMNDVPIAAVSVRGGVPLGVSVAMAVATMVVVTTVAEPMSTGEPRC